MDEQCIHRFTPAIIPLFETCEFCGEKILSAFNSAYQCAQCLKYCHKSCRESADSIYPCRGFPDDTIHQEDIFNTFSVDHTVVETSMKLLENILKAPILRKDSMAAIEAEETKASPVSMSNESDINFAYMDPNLDNDNEDPTPLFTQSPSIAANIATKLNRSLSESNINSSNDILSNNGFMTVIVQQGTEIPISSTRKSISVFCKVTLLPWGNERYSTGLCSFNDGYPDWDNHGNTLSFDYPGALPKVNPLIRIILKTEGSVFTKQVLGEVQVALRNECCEANKYHDDWYPVYREGKKTPGRLRVSYMFCPSESDQRKIDANPQKTHYFEKANLDVGAFRKDCPVCRKSLGTAFGGVVDGIFKCLVCGMMVHKSCKDKAKAVFKCIPKKKEGEKGGDISDKLLQKLKKSRILVYNQPIAYFTVYINQVTFFSKTKHKSIYFRLVCDQNEQVSDTILYDTVIDLLPDGFTFVWPIFDPSSELNIRVMDRLTTQLIGEYKVSLVDVEFAQSEKEMANALSYNPLRIADDGNSVVKTYDLFRYSATNTVSVGSISLLMNYISNPNNLASSQPPVLPPIPDMTPAVASDMWVRAWQIAKIFIDFYDIAVFAVSWESPMISASVAIGFYAALFSFSWEYIHVYLLMGVVLLLISTFVLRKKRIIARTIQTNAVTKDSSFDVISSSLINLVNTPVNQMKNSLSGGTLVLFCCRVSIDNFEKLYHLCLWTDVSKTRYVLISCIFLTIFAMVIPLRFIIACIGACFLFPKKISLLPYVFGIINYMNSLPSDDQVNKSLRPSQRVAITQDGLSHNENTGFSIHFVDAILGDISNKLWRKVYLSMGYDGLIRAWKKKEEVTQHKGFILLNKTSVQSVRTEVTYRDLAAFGIDEDCQFSAGVTNTIIISLQGSENPIWVSVPSVEERDLFVNYLKS